MPNWKFTDGLKFVVTDFVNISNDRMTEKCSCPKQHYDSVRVYASLKFYWRFIICCDRFCKHFEWQNDKEMFMLKQNCDSVNYASLHMLHWELNWQFKHNTSVTMTKKFLQNTVVLTFDFWYFVTLVKEWNGIVICKCCFSVVICICTHSKMRQNG